MIDLVPISARFHALSPFLNERERRLLAASEARTAGRGGVAAVSRVTGIARSTIGRALADLRAGAVQLGDRVRRVGGSCKPAIETQPGLLKAFNALVQSSIRGGSRGCPTVDQQERAPSVCGPGRAQLHHQPEAGRAPHAVL